MKKLATLVGGPGELAKRSGIPRRTIGNYLSGKSEPGREQLLKLATGGEVNLEWLTSGKGEPRGAESNASERLRYHSDSLRSDMKAMEPSPLDHGLVFLPLYELRAGASPKGVLVDDGEQPVNALAFRQEWIRQTLRVSPSDLRLIYVEGDSMEPDLRAGDIILVDHTDTTARREGIYVIRMDDALLVKQLQRLPGGQIEVISRNPAYKPFTVDASTLNDPGDFVVVGRVVWACRRF